MEAQDTFKLRGALHMLLCDAATGKVVEERKIDNLIVSVGKSWILGQLQSVNHVTSQNIGFIAVGSVSTAPTTADSALGGEVTRLAISAFSTTGLTVNPPSWQAQCAFATNQGNTTLAEIGLFNSSGAGTIVGHATYASFVKATSNTLNVSYTISAS